jgi:hypothetical protein
MGCRGCELVDRQVGRGGHLIRGVVDVGDVDQDLVRDAAIGGLIEKALAALLRPEPPLSVAAELALLLPLVGAAVAELPPQPFRAIATTASDTSTPQPCL